MTVQSGTASGARRPTTAAIIDCDVHEYFTSPTELAPYLEHPWKSWVGHWSGLYSPTYVHPLGRSVSGSLAAGSAKAAEGKAGIAGVDYDLMRAELLDRYGVRHAVLTGLFHPALMRVQPEFACAVASAYNDWLIDTWLNKDRRLLGSIQIAPQRPAEAAREIDRVGRHPSMVQVMLPETNFGYGEPHYHPIFEAAERNGLLVALHQSSETHTPVGLPAHYIEFHADIPLAAMAQIASLIYGGIFERYPRLKAVVLEAGFIWLPYLMRHLDQQYRYLGVDVPWVSRLPSETIRERIRVGTQPIEEMTAKEFMAFIDLIGSDEMLLFCTDYPHFDYDEPLRALPSGLPRETLEKIMFGNAQQFYGFAARAEPSKHG